MIFRDNKFIIPKTIGPNVNVDGIVEEINRGQTRVKVDPSIKDLKQNDTEDGTREETKVQA